LRVLGLIVVVIGLAACVKPDSVTCANHIVCPQDRECDLIHELCVTHAQATVCDELADGSLCVAGPLAGVCDRGYCIPSCGDGVQDAGEECDCGVDPSVSPAECLGANGDAGSTCSATCTLRFCGNGVVDPGEACDDANFDNTDDCALGCQSDVTCGNGFLDFDAGEACDDGNLKSHDGCSSACISETASWHEWHGAWAARQEHAMAYDSATKRLVMVGGLNATGPLGDMWVRQSSATAASNRVWTQTESAVPAVREHRIAYDSGRQVTVLFGGFKLGNASNETWEYDGTSWTKRTPTVSPPPRFSSAMVYDVARGKIVMFGGANFSAVYGDTWTYDGTTWTDLGITGPSARYVHAMAYDESRGKTVLFGGTTGFAETWELSGSTWTKITTATTPAGRYSHAMAYSVARGKVVMFGGVSLFGEAGDTWEYDGAWTQIATIAAPVARNYHSLAYDRDNSRIVLVGGTVGADNSDEIWEYDGQWTRSLTGLSPSARLVPITHDEVHDRVLRFSGFSAPDDGVWSFDGVTWSLLTTAGPIPPARTYHALAYDSARDRLVIFGGRRNDTSAELGDTWTWNGTWTNATGSGPSARDGAAMAYDASGSVMVLFGGYDPTVPTFYADTWELDGTTWTQHSSVNGPAAQSGAGITYDPDQQQIVVFGRDGSTFAYKDHAWTKLFDVSAGGPGPRVSNLVFDPERRRVVCVGGVAIDGVTTLTDLWELEPTGWVQIAIGGDPPVGRIATSVAAHRGARSIVLFGGVAASGVFDDTWLLQYRSSTLDEVCGDAIDNDADGVVDAADPDC
jgi:cysteine-rich repeat protein